MLVAHMRSSFAEAFFPRLSEWTPAVTIAVIGWVLIVNDTLMTPDKRGYGLMLTIAPQWVWGWAMIAFGFVRLTILFINGAWRRSPYARAVTAGLCMFFWMQITLSFAPVFGFAFVMAAGYLGTDLVNVFRAMRDARIVDDAYARGKKHDARGT